MLLASVERVEEKLRDLIERLDQSDDEVRDSLRDSLPEPRILALHLDDLDRHYWTELSDGRMRGLHQGTPSDPDIRVRASSDELVSLIEGKSRLVPAYLTGRVKIKASFAEMLQLRKML